jgi:hypothetical protein
VPNPVIATRRLHASGLLGTHFATPEEVVGWFGAVQSQDYAGASWGIGQRLGPGATASDIDEAFDAGRILRTHVLRPTWHFILPADIRWVLELTGPAVQRRNGTYARQMGLDGPALRRGIDSLARALDDQGHRTRRELAQALEHDGIPTNELRLTLLVMNAELEGVICSGPRRGRQFTYALLDERVPASASAAAPRSREAAVAELARRYFTSHGPAEPRDFAWWSGLTIADARAGLELAGQALVRETIDGTDWWWAPPRAGEAAPTLPADGPLIQLLPNYDEYLGSYRDHSQTFDPAMQGQRWVAEVFAAHLVVRNGMAIGGWKRELSKDEVVIRPDLLVALNPSERAALERASVAYGRFLGLPARIEAGSL